MAKNIYLFTLRSLHLQPVKGNKIGPLKLHPINFCPKFGRSPILKKIIDSERKTLSDWYKLNYKINYEPIQSVYLQHDGVTRDKKIILINSRLFTMDFSSFSQEKVDFIQKILYKSLCLHYEQGTFLTSKVFCINADCFRNLNNTNTVMKASKENYKNNNINSI